MQKTSTSEIKSDHRIAGFIGNILDHYDNALFGLLAPFLAPLFFAGQDPITALILTKLVKSICSITGRL